MSRNDGTGDFWDDTGPADGDYLNVGAQEIRDVRKGVENRIKKEHVLPADSDVGGEHIMGSAMAYYGGSYPTLRPDGVTSLDSDDTGRIFIGTNGGFSYWDGSAWDEMKVVDVNQLADGLLTTAKIADGAVTTDKIADGAVGTAEIADGAVGTTEIADNAVGAGQIADGAVGTTQLASAGVTEANIASGLLAACRIGAYTGNGNASPGKAITGLGFKPDFVLIQKIVTNNICIGVNAASNPGRLSDASQGSSNANSDFTSGISYDTDGFTILTASDAVNGNSAFYCWIAIKANTAT